MYFRTGGRERTPARRNACGQGTASFPVLLGVIEEALAGLAAQLAGADHLADEQGAAVLGIAGLLVQRVHDGLAHIQADQVAQSQRAHGVVGAQLHGRVDALCAGHAGVQQVGGLVDHGDEDLIHHEAGGLVDLHGLLADLHGQIPNGGKGRVRGLGPADHFHQLHHGGGVEEVHPDEPVLPLGRRGDGGDRDGGGVGGQDSLALADLVQLGKDALLDVQILDGGFHHQVRVRSQVQIGREADLAGDGGLARLVQLALGHQLVQPLVQTGLGRLNDLVLDITDHHVESLAGEDLGNIQAHRAAADHYDFLHIM